MNFSPVVECLDKCDENHTPFLTKYPILEFKQESIVPVLIGHTSEEGGTFVSREYILFFSSINQYIKNEIAYGRGALFKARSRGG